MIIIINNPNYNWKLIPIFGGKFVFSWESTSNTVCVEGKIDKNNIGVGAGQVIEVYLEMKGTSFYYPFS